MNSDYKKLSKAYIDNTIENYSYFNSTGCPAGQHCPESKEKTRFFDNYCPAGFYCNKPNGVNVILKPLPQKCPESFYCPENSYEPLACPSHKPRSRMMSKSVENCF